MSGHSTHATDGRGFPQGRAVAREQGAPRVSVAFPVLVTRVRLARLCAWPHFRHINIGSRFQAEIPELQERSLAGMDEHVASLVWKPWGDVMTNPETQDRGG